jgi:hypothetical protein
MATALKANLPRPLIVSLFVAILWGGSACKTHRVANNIPAAATPSPLAMPTDDDPDLKLSSEIELRRVYSHCRGCGDYSITLRRATGDIFADASVIRTDLDTNRQRHGTLSSYYYTRLLQLIKSQGILEMDDKYAMGTFDATVVKLSISIGDRRKVILTADEGDVPLKLWGLYLAIDGAAAQTEWTEAK